VLPRATCPVADDAAATSLALPIFGELTAPQQRHVVASIAEFYAKQ
jgi:dTDP-4-amino-4,6-dideoxygalactose transaminase